MRERGYAIVNEQATQIIKEGDILPWVDRNAFQQEVLRRQLAVESDHLASDEPIFLDRGLFDGEAYYISDNLPIPSVFHNLPRNRYAMALVIEELQFWDDNGVRFENLEFTRKITPIIENCYTSRGIPAARIPALPPEERVDYVLKVVMAQLEAERRVSLPAAPLLVPMAG